MKLSAPPDVPVPDAPAPTVSGDGTAAAPDGKSHGTWFGTADVLLAGLAVALGFWVVSFAARNSDLWVHLAAGQRLINGQYTLGSDPFSYSAAERVWVNHSWLFDLALYLAYSIHTSAPVLIKGVTIAAALGLVLAIRQRGRSLAPWAGAGALAMLAAVPNLTLSPLVGSFLLLGLTLYLVYGMRGRHSGWRFPAAIGITFWVWANVDVWFLLGPIALGLILIGEAVQQALASPAPESSGSSALGLPPALTTLARALLIGIVACMLNPNHIRVWQLPFELVGSEALLKDPQISAVVMMSPLDQLYRDRPEYGSNVNGFCYGWLMVMGGVLLGFGGRVRVSSIALWAGFAALSLVTVVAIPFFAVVAVPLVASQCNGLAARFAGRSRGLRLGSSMGRVGGLIAGVVLLVLAWPGWLSPRGAGLGEERRVAWRIEPDPQVVALVEQIESWRQRGLLPAETRGLIVSMEMANYCAWFAPREKVFINGRLNHHRLELPLFVRARADLGLVKRGDEPPTAKQARKLADDAGVGYLALGLRWGQPLQQEAVFRLWNDWMHWNTWYLNGRTTVLGYRPNPDVSDPVFDRLRVDPVAIAFDPNQGRTPPSPSSLPSADRDWRDDYLDPPRPGPIEAEQALGWVFYKRALSFRQGQIHQLRQLLLGNVPGVGRSHLADPNIPQPADGSYRAIPLLVAHLARKAIAARPDHPDGYYCLFLAFADPDLPTEEAERVLVVTTALRQALTRIPPPKEYQNLFELYRREPFLTPPKEITTNLARIYLGQQRGNDFIGTALQLPLFQELVGQVWVKPPEGSEWRVPVRDIQRLPRNTKLIAGQPSLLSLDLARQALILAADYWAVEPQRTDDERRTRFLDEVHKIEDVLAREMSRYRNESQQAPGVEGRYDIARAHGLTGEALRILREADLNDFRDPPRAGLERVALELAVGRVEDAARDLEGLGESLDEMVKKNLDARRVNGIRTIYRGLIFHKSYLLGDYATVGDDLVARNERMVGQYQAEMDQHRRAIGPFDLAKRNATLDTLFGQAIPLVPMLGETNTPIGTSARYLAGYLEWEREQEVGRMIVTRMRIDSSFYFRRGVLSVLEGDIVAARERFQQAMRIKPPPGWPQFSVSNSGAQAMLRMIDHAEKAAAR